MAFGAVQAGRQFHHKIIFHCSGFLLVFKNKKRELPAGSQEISLSDVSYRFSILKFLHAAKAHPVAFAGGKACHEAVLSWNQLDLRTAATRAADFSGGGIP